jgi:hypothetical protein
VLGWRLRSSVNCVADGNAQSQVVAGARVRPLPLAPRRLTHRSWACLALVAAGGLVATLDGRHDLLAVPRQSCVPSACQIELANQVTLTDPDGRLPTSAVILARDSAGRLFVSARTRDSVLMFSAAGRLLMVLGSQRRDVRAPNVGYFGTVAQPLVGAEDTVFVGHLLGQSMTALSKDLRVLPAVTSPYIPSMILDDGSFLVTRQIQTPELIGLPVHVVDRLGRIARSFGSDAPQYRADQRLWAERVAGKGRRGTVWLAPPGRYEFEQWDPSRGVRLQRLSVKSPWFVAAPAIARSDQRPNSMVLSLWEKDAVLWVLSRTADRQWTPPARRTEERPHDDAQVRPPI